MNIHKHVLDVMAIDLSSMCLDMHDLFALRTWDYFKFLNYVRTLQDNFVDTHLKQEKVKSHSS